MSDLKNIYENEINNLIFFQDSIYYGLDFYNTDYQVEEKYNFFQRKIEKVIDEKIKIKCVEQIYKNEKEKYLEIKIEKENNENESFKLIINKERVKLICDKIINNKKITLSKQFGFNGYIIYNFNDDNNNYILHQNVNNTLQYLENYKENIFCNVYSLKDNNFEFINKYPYSLVYDSVINCSVLNEKELEKLFEKENRKRKSTNSSEIKIKKDNKKTVESDILAMKLVYDNTKELYTYMSESLSKIPKINEIIQNGTKIIEEINNELQNKEKQNVDISELEILKNQRLEFLEMKKTTDEIIDKLQNILIN